MQPCTMLVNGFVVVKLLHTGLGSSYLTSSSARAQICIRHCSNKQQSFVLAVLGPLLINNNSSRVFRANKLDGTLPSAADAVRALAAAVYRVLWSQGRPVKGQPGNDV